MQTNSEIQLIGYVYQDPKCPNEDKYPDWVVFKVVVNRKYKDREGVEQEDTSWYECKSNSEKLSNIIKNYVKDKQGVLIKGIPKARAYIASDGSAQGSIEVLVNSINILTNPKPEFEKSITPITNTSGQSGKFKIGDSKKIEHVGVMQDDEIPF